LLINIRKLFKVGPGDIGEWKTNKNNVEIIFCKKLTINDVLGIVDGPKTNSVEIKKEVKGLKNLILLIHVFSLQYKHLMIRI